MTRGILRFLRGNTIALLALFVALGGTTYAATALPRNSVGPKQLKKNAVSNPKLKNGAVTGAKVADNSIRGADVLESSLGQVPLAANATQAVNATTAVTATSAASATNAAHATNADQLGGAPRSAVQRLVTGTCTADRAMSQPFFAGETACAFPVGSITMTPVANADATRSLAKFHVFLVVTCHKAGLTQLSFYNNSADASTLNWLYSDGTTIHASGNVLANSSANGHQDFSFAGARLEGQFIFAGGGVVTTMKLHAYDGTSFCEVRGSESVAVP